MWRVKLIKPGHPSNWPYTQSFFPREFKYKTAALIMIDSIKSKGGEAKLEKVKNKGKGE
jgi:hypothetical protein